MSGRDAAAGTSAQEASAYDFTRQLVTRQQVDDATYARAAAELGDEGLVDMVLLTGLYLSVCAVINAFDIDVPADPVLSRAERIAGAVSAVPDERTGEDR